MERITGRRTAAWFIGLMGALVLAPLATVGCGDDNNAGITVAKVGTLEVTEAYAHAVMDSGAVYFTVKNTGETDDALITVSTGAAGKAMLHRTVIEGATTKMEPVAKIEIPAKGETILQPGGYHVMLIDLKEPLEVGDTIGLGLVFEKAGSANIQVTVTPYGEE